MDRSQLRQLIDKRFSEALLIKDKKQQARKRDKLAAVDIANEVYHSEVSDQEAEERIKALFLSVNPVEKNQSGLPKGLLKQLIDEGYAPPEAMKEAWRVVGVQKKRYAARMSHGGEYPLGYKGRKNQPLTLSAWEDRWQLKAVRQKTGATYIPGAYRLERRAEKDLYLLSDFRVSSNVAGTIWLVPRKNPGRKISFSKWLTSVEREFDLAGVHPKWSGFTARKLYKVYTPKKAAELVILASKRSNHKNPVISGTFAGLVDNPILMTSKSQAQFFVDVLNDKLSGYPFTHIYISTLGGESRVSILITISLDPKSEWPNGILENSRYAKFHLGYDGKLEMITGYKVGKMRKVTVKHIGDAAIKIFRFLGYPQKNPSRQKVRKNPIAVFNPGGGTLIYGRVLELRAVKTSGQHRGERFRHTFGPHVQAIGLSNGSVLLKSNNGARLWKSI